MEGIDAKKARLVMELRAQGIRHTDTLAAIETIPREMFLPDALAKHAYDNVSLPIRHGQTISQPYVVARMTESLEIARGHIVLEIGLGSGYQAAVLCRMARRVYSIERLRPLLVEAERCLDKLRITNCTTRLGDGAAGWPEVAPFDRIIMTCAAARRPATLLKQLKPGGMLIAPIDDESGDGQILRRYHKAKHAPADSDEGITSEDLLPVRFVPLVTDIDLDPE